MCFNKAESGSKTQFFPLSWMVDFALGTNFAIVSTFKPGKLLANLA